MDYILEDPRKRKDGKALVYQPSNNTLDELQAISKVWKAIPLWKCKICGGKGHQEIDCTTKKLLDRWAKTATKDDRIVWG